MLPLRLEDGLLDRYRGLLGIALLLVPPLSVDLLDKDAELNLDRSELLLERREDMICRVVHASARERAQSDYINVNTDAVYEMLTRGSLPAHSRYKLVEADPRRWYSLRGGRRFFGGVNVGRRVPRSQTKDVIAGR